MTTLDLLRYNKELRELVAEIRRCDLAEYNKNIKTEVSQRKAYHMYGAAKVKVWVQRGQVTPVKLGVGNSKVTYNTLELKIADIAERDAKKQ